jgi:ubiquinone/menaquinone biosynthesis C-methylase UbiE
MTTASIKALKEWYRVVKPGGYLYIIAPRRIRQGRRILLVTSELGGVGYGLRV